MTIAWDFQSCADLNAAHVQRALSSDPDEPPPPAKVVSLLAYMASVSKPAEGATKMLVVLAKMAAAPWVPGMLEVRIKRAGAGVTIDVFVDDGQEATSFLRAAPVAAPFEEFEATISQHGTRLAPLLSKPALEEGTLRLLARGGSSARMAIPGRPVDVQKTIRRAVAIPREAFPDAASTRKLEADLEGLDEGWE